MEDMQRIGLLTPAGVFWVQSSAGSYSILHACSAMHFLYHRTTYILDGLRPFTVYCVRVAAATGAGGGVFSRREEARTFTDGE